MNLENKVVVITGVSSGIGLATCLQLLEKKAKVVGWGRNRPEISNPNFHFFETDVKDRNAIKESVKSTLAIFDTIHVLINNAGLGYFGYLEEMPEEEIETMLLTNIHGTIYASREVIPSMKSQQFGHIINISSTAGLEGMPQVAVYCATKYAVSGFSEALFRELRDFGIKVTCVYPGSVQTNFFDNSKGIKAHDHMMQPAEVAHELINILERSDNFSINSIVFRPLQIKPKK